MLHDFSGSVWLISLEFNQNLLILSMTKENQETLTLVFSIFKTPIGDHRRLLSVEMIHINYIRVEL